MSKLILPYIFQGVHLDIRKMLSTGRRLTNKHLATFYLGEGVFGQFSQVYSNVLQAMADNDQEYLQ